VPVIVKFSNDTELAQVPALLDLLFELGFDGVNFGNTRTAYAEIRDKVHPSERKLYDFFTKTFGGGVSGAFLKERSLALCARAVEYLKAGPPSQEFHVVRTGGMESWDDIRESEKVGVPLNQWFTGYFERLARDGHDAYRNLYQEEFKD
jgi:dihydroorotate dehydrogenase